MDRSLYRHVPQPRACALVWWALPSFNEQTGCCFVPACWTGRPWYSKQLQQHLQRGRGTHRFLSNSAREHCYHPATSAATGTLLCNSLRLLYCWAGCCTVLVLGATAVPGCWVARNLLVFAFGEQLLTHQTKRAPLLSGAAAWTDSRLLSSC
jgi:hypothetical protein